MLDIHEMIRLQRSLQERYKGEWESVDPAHGLNKLMWMIGEVGEVSQILKRKGACGVMESSEVRSAFMEEMADVLMFYSDVLLCFDIDPDEFERIYRAKNHRNMTRWKPAPDAEQPEQV